MQIARYLRAEKLMQVYNVVDAHLTAWMAEHGLTLLRISMGVIFIWFGALKFFPGASPAEDLIRDSITFLPMSLFLPFLAVWEVAIGLGFLIGKWMRATILLLFLQMPGTVSPLVLNPSAVWNHFPFELTLEGQYIIKNLVLVSAALVIGATVRGGGVSAKPLPEHQNDPDEVKLTAPSS